MNTILDQSVKDLLNEFGKGPGMKGAGATAALSAVAGTQILVSICKLTTGKEKYATAHTTIQEIQQQLETKFLPRLEGIMEADATMVETMLRMRTLRDNETNPEKKQALKLQAAATLQGATNTMLKLCTDCLEIMPLALQVHDTGLKSAQGDAVMAISNLIAAASSGLYASLKNIQAAKNADWVNTKRESISTAYNKLQEYKQLFDDKLDDLYSSI